MNKVVMDDTLRSKLNGLTTHIEFCDPSGEVVADCVPNAEYMRLLYDLALARHTDEEIEEMMKEPEGRPLADIILELERQYPSTE